MRQERKRTRRGIFLLQLLVVIGCFAISEDVFSQDGRDYQSTICNSDGTVTFQYWNPSAKKVEVDVQFAGRRPMEKDSGSGLCKATVGPAAPDMYPYCFIVDGIQVMDPKAAQYFPNEGFKNSLLEVPSANGALAHDIKPVPHGTVEYIHYYSKSLQCTNNALVYLPPNYMRERDQHYPVFYLISGTTDTEEVYYKVGRMNYILDNLIASGDAQKMIIVLPYGNPTKLLPPKEGAEYAFPALQFGDDPFSKDMVNDLMPYIEQHYRTVNDRDHRAIGGFSRGGNQGLSIGLNHLDKFSYLCSYSSFTSTTIPGVYDNASDTNSKLHLFWLGVGTDDFLFGNARDYMEFLDKKGIRNVKEFTHDKFGHTWMNAKYFLDKTLRLLFNPNACEPLMAKGTPAPAATGNEPQFTPGVMARMFPKPIISPEYKRECVVFRFKAPSAAKVRLCTDFQERPLEMERDSDGVWSIELKEHALDNYEYYFDVDGTKVADPNNMYLSPCKGFKPSYTNSPYSPYSYTNMGDITHGVVSYNLNRGGAWYRKSFGQRPVFIQLIPGKDMTDESWFKTGGAAAMADVLAGSSRSIMMTTSSMAFSNSNPDFEVHTLRADDFKNWPERRAALEQLLKGL